MLKLFIGLIMLVVPFSIFAFLIRIWPVSVSDPPLPNPWTGIWPCGLCDTLPFEPRMLVIVILAGLLGSFVHAATSFGTYVGNRRFVASWAWWYFLRLPVGIGLALILYFALRGGFLAPTTGTDVDPSDVINPFGFAAVAALAGMFSKQATDKLKELFDSLFRTDEDKDRGDKLVDPKPVIEAIVPATLSVGQQALDIVITGTGLSANSAVHVNGTTRSVQFSDPDRLTATLVAGDVAAAGELEVTVVNADADGGASDPVILAVQ